jgi:arginine-tRNA-protein transferase
VTPEQLDALLGAGMRRAGVFLYHAACSHCSACEPSRVDVDRFEWTRSWRRIRNRGDRLLEVSLAPASTTPEKLALFNLHRAERDLASEETPYGIDDYESFLVETCCEHTLEMQFRLSGELIAVSVIDCGEKSVSAVYTYFNPEYSKLSPGTYAILKQIEFCQSTKRQFVYLGMYVAANRHLSYKGRFRPQQRWVDCKWIDIHSDS